MAAFVLRRLAGGPAASAGTTAAGLVDFDAVPVQVDSGDEAHGDEPARGWRGRRAAAPHAHLRPRAAPPLPLERPRAAPEPAGAGHEPPCGGEGASAARPRGSRSPRRRAAAARRQAAWMALRADSDEEPGELLELPPRARPAGGLWRHPRAAAAPALSEIYVEPTPAGAERSLPPCGACASRLRAGELRLGYTADAPGPAAPRWVHAGCLPRARLGVRAGSFVSFSLEVPAARRQELLRALQRQAGAGGGAELRGWNHLPATARHWGSVAVPAPAPPRGDGAEGSEAGVRALLQALPPWQLEADYGEERPCAICHASMNQGDVVCRLPCRHVYHVGCIDRWLRVRATCPMDNLEIGPMLGA